MLEPNQEAGEPESQESAPQIADRVFDNQAIVRCVRARNRAYNKKLDEGESDFKASEAGRLAYLRAMPPLTGLENIRDFIACVTYAELAEFIQHSRAENYLEAAKVALAALRREEQTSLRRPGRPAKNIAAAENN
jgi:hypothetical protein